MIPGDDVASVRVALFNQTQKLPFTVDFSRGTNVDSAETIWKSFNFDDDEYEWHVTANGFTLNLDPKGSKANDALLSPRFEISPGRYDISVSIRGGDGYMPIKVGMVSDAETNLASFPITSLGKFTVSNTGSQFKEYNIEGVVETGGLVRFAFSTDPSFRCDPSPSPMVIERVSIAPHIESYSELPYEPVDFSDFSIYNVNNDADWSTDIPFTWKGVDDALVIDSPDVADDWAVTPLFEFKAGKVYAMSFEAEMEDSASVETFAGSSTHFTDLTIPLKTFNGSWKHKVVINVTDTGDEPSQDENAAYKHSLPKKTVDIRPGFYAIGLHAPTSGLKAAIRSFKIVDYEPMVCPDNVENLNASVDGAEVQLSWRNPQCDNEGKTIDSIEKIELLRNGEVIKTYESPGVGEEMLYSESLKDGYYRYTVIPYLNGNVPEERPQSIKVEICTVPDAIESVESETEIHSVFDITGKKVCGELHHGIYIVRASDGSTRKIIRK